MFRQWIRTLELCLEAQYAWESAHLVVQTIRHEKSPIKADTFADMIAKINKDEYDRDGTSQKLQPADWDFEKKARLLGRGY